MWAWQALRAGGDYLAGWAASEDPPAHEPAPFPVRVRPAADLEAAGRKVWRWEDPAAVDGPGTGFRLQALRAMEWTHRSGDPTVAASVALRRQSCRTNPRCHAIRLPAMLGLP